jgi:hypothetical protein
MGTMEGQLAEEYADIPALSRAASHVVVARVTGAVPKPWANLPFTEITLLVEEVVKWEGEASGTVRVVETGGALPLGPVKGTPRPGVIGATEVGFMGVPVMRSGERYLLFLGAYDGPIAEGSLRVLGVVQGKLKLDGNGVVRFNGDPTDLQSPVFAAAAAADGRPVADVIGEVKTSLE